MIRGSPLAPPNANGGGLDGRDSLTPCRQRISAVHALPPLALGGANGGSLRAILHTRLRARDQYTSSTFTCGKGRANPSSLHTICEGPTEYVNARWMESLHGFLHNIKWIMFHIHLDYFQKNHLLEVGLTQNRETVAFRMLTTVDLFYFTICEDLHE
jgi:hypothetical protein